MLLTLFRVEQLAAQAPEVSKSSEKWPSQKIKLARCKIMQGARRYVTMSESEAVYWQVFYTYRNLLWRLVQYYETNKDKQY